ncbi:MAG: TIGR04255 family protein, partial [Alphaproteobacteria bacterium]|nr:TIGR04255 family protein [Alphaproteobacteria bacterium]
MEMRPSHLPDYKAPPLNEVVLGVQFNQPVGYQQIRAGEVWSLYKSNYPVVEEQPPLAPSFEMFGGRPTNVLQFQFATGATHDRFWFLSESRDELIQFQADRLLHNWRKVGDGTNPYPRFERMIDKFRAELRTLETYLATLAPQK